MANWTYSEVFQKAWDSFKGNLPFTAGLTLVYVIGAAVLSRMPILGWLLLSPLLAGYTRCLLRIRKGEEMGYQDFFWGFLDLNRLAQIVLIQVLISIGTTLGFILLIIPGIWFLVSTFLASTHFVLFGGDAINSIKTSMEIVKQNWFRFFGFLCLIGFLNILGAICLFIGVLVTIPVTVLAAVIILESTADVARSSSHQ